MPSILTRRQVRIGIRVVAIGGVFLAGLCKSGFVRDPIGDKSMAWATVLGAALATTFALNIHRFSFYERRNEELSTIGAAEDRRLVSYMAFAMGVSLFGLVLAHVLIGLFPGG